MSGFTRTRSLSLTLALCVAVVLLFSSAVDVASAAKLVRPYQYASASPVLRKYAKPHIYDAQERQHYIQSQYHKHHRTLSSADHAALMQRVKDNLRDIKGDVQKIIDFVSTGAGKHQTYNRLAEFTDTIGHRISGSDDHAKAVSYMLNRLQADGLENVHGETVSVPRWSRGTEYAFVTSPRAANLTILALGGSVGTNQQELEAPVLVVSSFDDLTKQAAKGNSQGKIIVFNYICDWKKNPVGCYGPTVAYRGGGAVAAAQAGGVAALIRTCGGFSINSPHTGEMDYDDSVAQVPAASITLEDADMLQRMQDRNQSISIRLYMEAQSLPDGPSQNVVAEITGSIYPDQVVLVSGHLDSWDVGVGAMDDGGGAFISWSALSILRQLGLRPKRTLRFVGWSCEEFGGVGAQQYFDQHKVNISNYDLVLESDMGVFRAQGMQFQGNAAAMQVMQQVGTLLQSVNTSTVVSGGGGTDIDPWVQAGVPGGSILNANDRYFWFHHSNGDRMNVLDPDDVDLCAITWAVNAYAVASLDDMLPR